MGYKIHSGFSVFFILPLILKQAELDGLVEKLEDGLEEIDYNTIKNSNDSLSVNKLEYALKSTTIKKLREALESNSRFKTVDIDILEFDKAIKGYRVDASRDRINQLYQNKTYLLPINFDTLFSLVDFFCSLLNRQYINIENALEYIKEEKGSTIFSCDVYEKGKNRNEVIEVLHNKGVV